MSETTLSVRYTACPPPPTPDQIGVCGPCQDACSTKGSSPGDSAMSGGLFGGNGLGGGFAGAATSLAPIRYANGAIFLPQYDIAVPQGGFFSHVRFYSNKSSSPFNGPCGFNWWVSSQPYIVALDDAICVVFDPNRPWWFDVSGSDYSPRYGVVGTNIIADTTAHTLTFVQTANGRLEVTQFNDLSVWPNPGGFLSHTDSRGITTTATYAGDGRLSQLQRTFTLGGITIIETLIYVYYDSGTAIGQLQTVTLLRTIGSADPIPISQIFYIYFGASDPSGNVNDLKSAAQQFPDGMGGWNTVGMQAYRWYLGTESNGIIHGLKMHFGPEACRLLFNAGIDPTSAAESAVEGYADHYFEYDPDNNWAVREKAAVCETCPGGGITDDTFAFAANPRTPTPGFNIWAMKCTQTLPDLSQIIVYSNYAGAPMLKVQIDPTGENQWMTAFIYTADGQPTWEATPAAVNGYLDTYDDLLHFESGVYEFLNTDTGLILVTNYYASTDIGAGAVQDYIQNENVRNGQSGSDILIRSYTYTDEVDLAGNAVYLKATDTSYPSDIDPTVTIITSYVYFPIIGTVRIQQKTTTLPAISSTTQNGSGTSNTINEYFDNYGNTYKTVDENGIVNNYTIAGPILGAVTREVLNYQSGGSTAPGVNFTSDFTQDNQGRPTLTLEPSHTVVLAGVATTVRKATFNVYIQSIQPGSGTWAPDQSLTGTGYATGTDPTYTYSLVNPVTLLNLDKDGRTLDHITSVRTTGSGALSPTDSFAQTDWKTWRSTQLDIQHRNLGNCVYFLIPSSGIGVAGINFKQTALAYDALERLNRTLGPGGTIRRVVYTAPQRPQSIWIGTNDNGATDADPTGGGAPGNNMVMILSKIYDGGLDGGNGNPTQVTKYVSDTVTRVTNSVFDFRDREINLIDATLRLFVSTFDNLDRRWLIQGFSSVGGILFSQKRTNFDDLSRPYQTLTFAVNVTTGAVGNALISNIWRDPSGNILQTIPEGGGKAFTKQTFNGVNWVLSSYLGFNTSGTNYTQAGIVTGDIIVEQTDNTHDEAGNIVSAAISQRLNDADPSTTGALTSSLARVSFVAAWVDGIDRQIAGANYGAASSFTRPDVPPASSDTVLVGGTAYDDAGRPFQATDPMGVINQTAFDNANRTSQTIEDVGGLARTTNFTQTLDDLPATMTAVNAVTGNQTTTWLCGTTLADSGVARNDLVRSVIYPDGTLGWATLSSSDWSQMTANLWGTLPAGAAAGNDATTTTYNRLGEPATFTDQRGTVHTFLSDLLGRPTHDCITTVGSNTDSAVLRISRAYEIRGMISTITSADNATPGAGTILNQVALSYNDFGQLQKDQQEHNGAVTSGTLSVQYAHDDGSSDSNQIRLNGMTYPNLRTIGLDYGTAGGMSDFLSRVDAINDTSSGTVTLASYLYLGAAVVIRITSPEPEIWLDLWGGVSGVFAGIDLFGNVSDQRWQNNISGTPADIDRFKYGRDRNSNPIWKANVVGTAAVAAGLDEFYVLDPLNRLDDMQRGVLNSTTAPTGITGTPSVEQNWTLDPVGNWSNFLTKAAGSTTLDQTRTANLVNEITNITETTGPTWVVPAYDPAGNMITMPKVSDPTQSLGAIYDAWQRQANISDDSGPVADYKYDGRNFRIVKDTYTSGVISETRHFFFTAAWQNVEERIGTSTTMDKQYVWGLGYVDKLICRDDATPQRLYACQDANFNLTSIVDASSGDVAERYLFDPYGLRTIMNESWTVISASAYNWLIGHQGLMYDPESGLIYNRRRPITPPLGRFTGRDPLRYWDGSNLYQYLRGSPLTGADPTGESDITIVTNGHYKVIQPESEVEDALLSTLSACDQRNPECEQQAREVAHALWNAVASKPPASPRKLR